MAILPGTTDLLPLSYSYQGKPFAQLLSRFSVSTLQLDYGYRASPFIALFANTGIAKDLGNLTYTLDGLPFVQISSPTGIVDAFQLTYSLNGLPGLSPVNNLPNVMLGVGIMTAVGHGSTNYHATMTGVGIMTADYIHSSATMVGEGIMSATWRKFSLDFDTDFSVSIAVQVAFDTDFSTKVGIGTAFDTDFGTQIGVLVNDLVPVTNICAIGNPFEPTIVSNGEYISWYSSTSGSISDPSTICLYISMKNAGLTDCSMCDLEGFSFNLDYKGGSWSINSLCSSMGSCWQEVPIYTLKGVIQDSGMTISSNIASYNYSGNFGNPNLSRPFHYAAATNPALSPLLTNQTLNSVNIVSWTTASAVCEGLGIIGGASVQWLIPDVPVSNFKLEEGGDALDGMASMATRAGGVLLWNGDSSYKVVYPDFTQGDFEIPDCNLILPGGLVVNNHCNINENYIIIGSAQPQNAGPILGQDGQAHPQVQLLTQFNTRLTADSPPLIYDLPYDYDEVFAQILVNVGQSTAGNNGVSLSNFMTTDPQEYFEYNPEALGIEFIFNSNIGGVIQPQVRVDYLCLPLAAAGNAAIENSNFWFKLYYTRKQVAPPANTDAEGLGLMQNNLRFMKTADYQIQCLFFGSLPLPGMKGIASLTGVKVYVPDCNSPGSFITIDLGDINISAVIQSVSFQFPGYLTINLANFARLQFYNAQQIAYQP